jgi:spore cortex formation protein SpoVR/YcgB (stage V sporulation)
MPAIVAGLDNASSSASLPDPASLQTLQDIVDALHVLEAEESTVDDALTALVDDRESLDRLLDQIEGLQPAIDASYRDASDMASRVEQTATVAERISQRVRQLDLEQVSCTSSIHLDVLADLLPHSPA